MLALIDRDCGDGDGAQTIPPSTFQKWARSDNMNPVRVVWACVFLGVCEFEYVSVKEFGHVRVKCVCMYICICPPYVIMKKFAIMVIHYGPLDVLCWPPFCKKTSMTITFELKHLG